MLLPPETITDETWATRQIANMPLSRLHLSIFVICALALFFDGIELTMSIVLGMVLGGDKANSVSSPQAIGMVIGAAAIGGAFGAVLLGRYADSHGRRYACLVILLCASVTSIMTAFTHSLEQLALMRFVSGFFLGAMAPVMNVYLVDVLPAHNRARLMLLLVMASSLSAFASPLLTRWFAISQPFGLDGWRMVLLSGGIFGLVTTALFYLLLPESVRWLAGKKRNEEAQQIVERFGKSRRLRRGSASDNAVQNLPDGAPLASADTAQQFGASNHTLWARVLLFCLLQFLVPWAMIGFLQLSGVVLMQRGYEMKQALTLLAYVGLGVPLGGLMGSLAVDYFRRRSVLIVCALSNAAMGMLFALTPSVIVAVIAGALFNMFVIVYFQVLMIYGAEFFPDAMRATAVGGGYTFNRVAAFLAPTLLLPFLHNYGRLALFLVFGACMLSSAALIYMFGPGRRVTDRLATAASTTL